MIRNCAISPVWWTVTYVERNRLGKIAPGVRRRDAHLKAWGSECHQQLTGRDNQQSSAASVCWQSAVSWRNCVCCNPWPGGLFATHRRTGGVNQGLGDVPVRLNAFHAHGVYGERKAGRAPRRRMWNNWLMRYGARGESVNISGAIFVTCRMWLRRANYPRMLNTSFVLLSNTRQSHPLVPDATRKARQTPARLFRAVRLPLKTVERHIRRVVSSNNDASGNFAMTSRVLLAVDR